MNYADQPSRIKSVCLASTPELTSPLQLRWVWRSGKRTGNWLGFCPSGVVVGSEGQIHGLDLEAGQVRWCLDGLEPIGLCSDVLLAHELGPSNFVVHAFDTDGRRLWQVTTSRQVNTDYCAGRDGFYAWPRYPTPSGTRLTADFHPLAEPDRPSEVEGPPNYYIAELRERAGWLASYRWGPGPSQCAVYRERHPVWSVDYVGSNSPEVWSDTGGWVICTYETTEGWSACGQRLWTAPGLKRRWVGESWVLGEGPEGLVSYDRSSGEARLLRQGGLRDLALAGDQIWWLNWEAFGCDTWTYPLAELGIWARADANRLVIYAGQLFLGGSDGSIACFSPRVG